MSEKNLNANSNTEVQNQPQNRARTYLRQMFNNTLNANAILAITLTISVVVDIVVIGQFFGVNSLAAYGFIVPIIMLKTAIFSAITAGEHAICSSCIGHADIKGANGCFNASLIVMIIIGIVFGGLIAIFAVPLIQILDVGNQNAEVIDSAKFLIFGLAIGFPFEAYNLSVSQLLLVDNDRERTNQSAVLFAIVSIVGDFVNVFVLNWGMFGIGLATSFAFIVQSISLSFHFKVPTANCELNPKLAIWENFSNIISIGSGLIIQAIFGIIKIVVMNFQLVLLIGLGGVSAYAIQNNVESIFCLLPVALGTTVIALAGVYQWEKNAKALKDMARRSLRMTLIISVIVAVVLFIISPWVSKLYLKDAIEAEIATKAIRYFAMGMVFYSFNSLVLSLWLGTNHLKQLAIVGCLGDLIYVLVFIFVLPIFMGEDGLWAAFPASQILMSITILIVAMISNKAFSISSSSIFMLNSFTEVANDQQFEMLFSDMKGVKEASEKAGNLCRKNGIDEIRSNSISLCVEEMCKNLVVHGIENPKSQYIDVRVVVIRGNITLRIRDNCPNFNPFDHSKYFKKNDPASGIGMRMVHSMLKSVNYWSSLRMNNLTMEI